MNHLVIPVILSGGSGTRLWPKSRKHYPKQVLKLAADNSMLQETALRVSDYGTPIVVCNEDHRFLVAEQLLEIGKQPRAILLEPHARNTAPAIALAALHALQVEQDPVLIVLPADHLIQEQDAFIKALEQAVSLAQANHLVTFGIVPSSAETGYGYLRVEEKNLNAGARVEAFVEKPDEETAQAYVKSGNYLWNSGMFVFKANTYLQELDKYQPDIKKACIAALEQAEEDLDFIRVAAKPFADCPNISVDYAVMEQTDNAWVVPLDAKWSDLGSWQTLWDVHDKDSNGNVKLGDVLDYDCEGSLFYAEDHLITAIGLKDMIVIDTKDALMILPKGKAQEVKHITDDLEQGGRSEHLLHREVHRPWGSYDSIDNGERYQVKRITVKPGKSLSLQYHNHRAEHWVVVRGTALVQIGDKEQTLKENESVYIPLGITHRLTNPGNELLHIIEVQSGSYLGEDDIVRLEDKYGRS